ncbi:hypothetical protein [Streptomyces sp. ODS28]
MLIRLGKGPAGPASPRLAPREVLEPERLEPEVLESRTREEE